MAAGDLDPYLTLTARLDDAGLSKREHRLATQYALSMALYIKATGRTDGGLADIWEAGISTSDGAEGEALFRRALSDEPSPGEYLVAIGLVESARKMAAMPGLKEVGWIRFIRNALNFGKE